MKKRWGRLVKTIHMNEPADEGLGDFLDHFGDEGGDDSGGDDSDDGDLADVDGDSDEDDESHSNRLPWDDEPPKDNEDEDEDEEDEEDDEEDTESNISPELAELKAQNAQLMQLLQQQQTQSAAPKKEEPKKIDAFGTDSFKQLGEILELSDTEQGVLKSFMEQFGAQVASTAVQDVMSQAPTLVNTEITKAQQAQDVKTKFYENHPALGQVKGYVAQVANTVAQENNTLSVEQVLEETAKRTYQVLGIKPSKAKPKGKKDAVESKRRKKPAFAKTPKARKPVKKKGKLESEIDAMLKL